jgi:ABC-type branched-subunit amino acid transport system ATPase component
MADSFERADVVLQVADLRAGYGRVPVLHGVNLQIHEGEAVGIVGHNGMGKTTLLKVIMGLMPSTGGRIELDGTEATVLPLTNARKWA